MPQFVVILRFRSLLKMLRLCRFTSCHLRFLCFVVHLDALCLLVCSHGYTRTNAIEGGGTTDTGEKAGIHVWSRIVIILLTLFKHIPERCLNYVRFEVFTAVTIKNGVFWDVTPCGSCKNRLFGGT
jgi:hypothetical protein